MTNYLYGVATGVGITTLWAGFCWGLDRRRRGLSVTKLWR